jgi:hypothetical protein
VTEWQGCKISTKPQKDNKINGENKKRGAQKVAAKPIGFIGPIATKPSNSKSTQNFKDPISRKPRQNVSEVTS